MILCFFVFKWCTGPGNIKISTTHTEYFNHNYHHLDKSFYTFSMRKEAQDKLIFWGCCLSVRGICTPTNACIGGVYDILVHWQEMRGLVGWQWACVATIGGHGWKKVKVQVDWQFFLSSNIYLELDPVGSTVLNEAMKLCTWRYWVSIRQYQLVIDVSRGHLCLYILKKWRSGQVLPMPHSLTHWLTDFER